MTCPNILNIRSNQNPSPTQNEGRHKRKKLNLHGPDTIHKEKHNNTKTMTKPIRDWKGCEIIVVIPPMIGIEKHVFN